MGTGGVLAGGRWRVALGALLAATVLALLLAGCGGGGETTGASSADTGKEEAASTVAETEEAPQGSSVSTGIPSGGFGRVVVSQAGFTFYAFSKDKPNSGKTACYGRCEKVWLPYTTVGKPTVALKARASQLGTMKRKDGTIQVTYGGWPLYSHIRDGLPISAGAHEAAGKTDAGGREQFGGVWYPVNPAGEVVH